MGSGFGSCATGSACSACTNRNSDGVCEGNQFRWIHNDKELCKKEYPNGCKDGITHNGVLMSNFNPGEAHILGNTQNYCPPWETADDGVICDVRNHASMCTKATVRHVNRMSVNSAMFLLKRTRCDQITNRCFTYKAGKCMTLTTGGKGGKGNYFSSIFNGDKTTTETKEWTRAAIKAMKDGVGVEECTNRGLLNQHQCKEQGIAAADGTC